MSINQGSEEEGHLLRRINQHKTALSLHEWVRATFSYLVLHLDNTNDRFLSAGGTSDGGRPIGFYHPGVEIYLRRGETP